MLFLLVYETECYTINMEFSFVLLKHTICKYRPTHIYEEILIFLSNASCKVSNFGSYVGNGLLHFCEAKIFFFYNSPLCKYKNYFTLECCNQTK